MPLRKGLIPRSLAKYRGNIVTRATRHMDRRPRTAMIPHMARLRSNLLVASFLRLKSAAPVSVSGPPIPRNAQTAMNARKNGAIA